MQLPTYLTNADAYPQFVVSRIDKVPCNPVGIPASHKDSINWMKLDEAIERIALLGPTYKLGYSITSQTKLFFIDIDKAVTNGEWSKLAYDLCILFSGCFIEISQSGTGLHIMGRYTGELKAHKNKNTELNIELYTHDRFVLFGGISPQGDWNTDATQALNACIDKYWRVEKTTDSEIETVQISTLTDEEIIAKARAKHGAREVFGGASFSDLYDANTEVLIRVYPSQTPGKPYDASSVDLAIANMLAIQGCDEQQIERIMKSSALAIGREEKWGRGTYLLGTILKAISSRSAVQLPKKHSNELSEQSQVISDLMPEEFQGCYYVKSEREIYTTNHGLLNQEAFNVCFGVPNQQTTPYKIFKNLASISGHIVDHLGFRPDLPHGEITERENEKFINTYKPFKAKMKEGNIDPFFKFFSANFPDPRDQRALLSYAALQVQKPGVKAQWCPVLHGVQGCGKTLFIDLITYAIGVRYTHKAKGDEFENRFNTQWFGKTFIAIEDPQMKEGKLEEKLKQMITQSSLSFEGKGKNARMGDFPANFILALNNFDLFQKKADARRFAVFMSALQTPEDLVNAGLTDAEWRKIVNWINNGGKEIFAHFLFHYDVDPEFDFSDTCVTSPHTATTDAAIEASRNNIELIILDEIEQGRIGFQGGFISSVFLTLLLTERKVGHMMRDNQRGMILKELGYVPHPGFVKGRTSRNVSPDNRRPTLFVKKNHFTIKSTDKEFIMKAYEEAQK